MRSKLDINEFSILNAPVPLTITWWKTLNRKQKISFTMFVICYITGTILVSITIINDSIFKFQMDLVSVKCHSKAYHNFSNKIGLIVHAGLWRNKLYDIIEPESTNSKLYHEYAKAHLKVIKYVWERCRKKSLIPRPFRYWSSVFFAISIILLFGNTFTVALFRPLMIILNILAVISFLTGCVLMFATAKFWHICIVSQFERDGQYLYLRSRSFNGKVVFEADQISLWVINIFIFVLMLILGTYLICVNSIS